MREMRWNCDEQGCFNVKHRLKLGIFDDCFPGKVGMGDADGLVEIGGNFLLLEWKSSSVGAVPTGQRIMFENITRLSPFVVYVVNGDAETMRVDGFSRFWKGARSPYRTADVDVLKRSFRAWSKHAQLPPVPTSITDRRRIFEELDHIARQPANEMAALVRLAASRIYSNADWLGERFSGDEDAA